MTEDTWVAETAVIWLEPDGSRQPGKIAVGLPTRRETGEWGCVVFVRRRFTIYGFDSMQALMLGLTFIGYELEHFVSIGGRAFYDNDEEDHELDLALLMGPLLRPPPARDQ